MYEVVATKCIWPTEHQREKNLLISKLNERIKFMKTKLMTV